MSDRKTKVWSKLPWIIGAVLTLVVIGIAFVSAFLPACYENTAGIINCPPKWFYLKQSTPNELGDTLAGFAGALAFIWIVVTVAMQSIELSDQRSVMGEQKDEFANQNANMKEQIYDNTFFQMLSTLGDIIEAIDLNSEKYGRTSGRDCFKIYYARLTAHLEGASPADFDMVNEEFFVKYGHEFGHYFRFLYNFFRFIDQSEYTKEHHVKVLRAFLSDYELLLIYYNCLTTTGSNFEKYLTKYAVFDNLPDRKMIEADHLSRYPPKAFGRNRGYDNWVVTSQ
ncbi:MAG: hypothetical protein ACI9KK_000490 [Ascidiaceihabitans sp.]